MNVITDIRKGDLIRLQMHFLFRSKGNWVFVGVIALAVIAWAIYSSNRPFTAKMLSIAVFSGLIGGIAGLLITSAINTFTVLASSSQKVGVLGRHEYEIRPDGLFERTEANEQLSKWSGIASVIRLDHAILVQMNAYLFHIIPKRSFPSGGEYDQFFEQLRTAWQNAAA